MEAKNTNAVVFIPATDNHTAAKRAGNFEAVRFGAMKEAILAKRGVLVQEERAAVAGLSTPLINVQWARAVRGYVLPPDAQCQATDRLRPEAAASKDIAAKSLARNLTLSISWQQGAEQCAGSGCNSFS